MPEEKLNEDQVDSVRAQPDYNIGSYNGNKNVTATDQILNINQLFQQTLIPSLARQICTVVDVSGAGGIFNVRQGTNRNDFEIVRRNFNLEKLVPIKTGITREAIDDIKNTFGASARTYIGTLLRSLANKQENESILSFLRLNSVERPPLVVQDPLNAETNTFNTLNKVYRYILEANSRVTRTFASWVVMPYQYLASLVGASRYQGADNSDGDVHGIRPLRIGLTNFYINPDTSDMTVYLGLKDKELPSRSSVFFGDMVSDITQVVRQDSGQLEYFIWNRYGIAANPLHDEKDPMLFKFEISGITENSD